MSQSILELPKEFLFIPLIIGLGLALGGYYISNMMVKAKAKDKYIKVEGIAEREVVADRATWPLVIRGLGNDVATANKMAQDNVEKVKDFLLQQGIKSEEMEMSNFTITEGQPVSPTDLTAKYSVASTILVKTTNVEAVKKAIASQHVLGDKGVLFGPRYEFSPNGPTYEYSGVIEAKKELFSEAMKNARSNAEQLAKDGDAKIGNLKNINQGLFTIGSGVGEVRDVMNMGPNNEMDHKKSINKKISAAVTLEFELE